MLELRRGRSQSHDSPLMGTLHEVEIDVLGITGITVDRSKLAGSSSKKSNGLSVPEKMKAVVAVFSEGHFCASSGLSHHLRKTPSESTSQKQGSLIALWSKRSRTSKIKFAIQMDQSMTPSDPAIFELWIALTDGKGENKTCVSFPIGLGTLPVDGEQSKPFHLDLPLSGIAPSNVKDGSGSTAGSNDDLHSHVTGEEKKVDENNAELPTVGSVYGLKSHDGSILRLRVECKRKKPRKDRRRTVRLSDLNEDPPSDDEGSKMFRPIETSSLVSESAYSLGDVVSSKLPTKTLDRNRADLGFLLNDIGGIDESQEMDFSDIGSRPSVDKSGKPLENGPKSAFTAISPGKTAPLTCSTGTIGKSELNSKQKSAMVRLVPDSSTVADGSPSDLGTLDPKQEEPSELGDSFRIYRKQIPAPLGGDDLNYEDELELPNLQPGAPSLLGNPDMSGAPPPQGHVPLVIRTVSQIRGKQTPSRNKRPLGDNRSRASAEDSLNRSIVSTGLKKENSPYCIPYCGVFGPMMKIPINALVKDGEEELVLRDFEDDHTLSTIETRNSSQIIAWHDSVRAYAAETSSIAGDNRGSLFDNQCVRDTQALLARKAAPRSSSGPISNQQDAGWWNDLPNATGCM
ncbi:hypothetical protein ACA910_011042 [Epithemia clementina (nom. ined.)]